MFNTKYHNKVDLLHQASKKAETDPGYLERHQERISKEPYDVMEDTNDYLALRWKYYCELLRG